MNHVSVVSYAAVSNVCAVLNLGNKCIAFSQAEYQRLDGRTGSSANDERSEAGRTGNTGAIPTEQARPAESALQGTSRFGHRSQLKICGLRERAQQELGSRFDIRKFHDEILSAGSLPMDMLDARINGWIKSEQAAGENPRQSQAGS